MKGTFHSISAKISLCLLCLFSLGQLSLAQNMDRIERSRMKDMLGIVKDTVKKNYYDPTYRGIDLDAKFKKAEERIAEVATTAQALGVIAQVLIDFNDSHLFFQPPPTDLAVEYGWRMQTFGDNVFVTSVRPGSDAEAKGLKVGDVVLGVSGFRPTRKELWKVLYYYNAISKRDRLSLTVASPGDTAARTIEIQSLMKRFPRQITFQSYFRMNDGFYNEENDKHRFQNVDGIAIWRMPGFDFDPMQVDSLMNRVRNGRSAIIDLRGNGGGYIKTLESLAGFFFDKDLKIAELKGRKKMDPMLAKTRGKDVYAGRVVVLIDGASGSCAELFARIIQLENRGKVVGDVSAGAVMQSIGHDLQVGADNIVPFGVSVTDADVVMSDGKSLEQTGVQPDELVIPTGEDLAKQRDPALAKAIGLLGGNITPEDAGKLFRYYYWKSSY